MVFYRLVLEVQLKCDYNRARLDFRPALLIGQHGFDISHFGFAKIFANFRVIKGVAKMPHVVLRQFGDEATGLAQLHFTGALAFLAPGYV